MKEKLVQAQGYKTLAVIPLIFIFLQCNPAAFPFTSSYGTDEKPCL